MNSLNSLLIEGNLVRDPETKSLPSGTMVSKMGIASNRSYKKGDEWEKEVSFFEVESWGKLAESVARNCEKGRGVRVVGRIKQERWESDGKQMSKVKIIAEHIEFKPKFNKNSGSGESGSGDQNESAPPDFPDDIPF